MTNPPAEGAEPREPARDPFAPPRSAYAAGPVVPASEPPQPTADAGGRDSGSAPTAHAGDRDSGSAPAADADGHDDGRVPTTDAVPPHPAPAARAYASGYPSSSGAPAAAQAGPATPPAQASPGTPAQMTPATPPAPAVAAAAPEASPSAAPAPAGFAPPAAASARAYAGTSAHHGPAGYAQPSAAAHDRPGFPTSHAAQGQPAFPPYRTPYGPAPRLPYPDLEPEPRRRRSLSVVWVVPLLVLALVAGLVGGVLGSSLTRDDRLADAGLPAVPVGSAPTPRASDSVAGIAAEVLPSVVSIQVSGSAGQATGSGFVLRQDGYILTNNHVVTEGSDRTASSIVVTFADGSQKKARVVGRTADYDLAVVKVGVKGLTPLALGDSDKVVVGDPVVAVGAPLGLAGTVTTGIVSALNRPVSAGGAQSTGTAFINAIQTDAAINPGNSGGPLVDAHGQVIGINSAIAQPPGTSEGSGGSIGLGFAIPSNQARRTAEQLIEKGHATYPVIGVLLDQRYTGEGVRVATAPQNGQSPITAGGPADRAGIKTGDVILAIDGRPVTEPDELIVAIRARTPGDTVVLRVRTGTADARDVRVKLDESQSD
ncbi:S1C family serine protease [Cellulomonas alba]|uniref:Trypsin-like peptidase domain-containing protein n=1 Tax=Cellulomonas alba TaxID=3053467 RepID=A0ABT7SHL9_9CELL|nr:trypsin-like peptidase domain-containing protein [Cellulomonas alba]MDM7855680.1 trypsin-like peptidase domain-containing protein [Cellulomonas alba]